MINANNDSYKYELLLAFVIDYCSYPFGDEVYFYKAGDHYKEIKRSCPKSLIHEGRFANRPNNKTKNN